MEPTIKWIAPPPLITKMDVGTGTLIIGIFSVILECFALCDNEDDLFNIIRWSSSLLLCAGVFFEKYYLLIPYAICILCHILCFMRQFFFNSDCYNSVLIDFIYYALPYLLLILYIAFFLIIIQYTEYLYLKQ